MRISDRSDALTDHRNKTVSLDAHRSRAPHHSPNTYSVPSLYHVVNSVRPPVSQLLVFGYLFSCPMFAPRVTTLNLHQVGITWRHLLTAITGDGLYENSCLDINCPAVTYLSTVSKIGFKNGVGGFRGFLSLE